MMRVFLFVSVYHTRRRESKSMSWHLHVCYQFLAAASLLINVSVNQIKRRNEILLNKINVKYKRIDGTKEILFVVESKQWQNRKICTHPLCAIVECNFTIAMHFWIVLQFISLGSYSFEIFFFMIAVRCIQISQILSMQLLRFSLGFDVWISGFHR